MRFLYIFILLTLFINADELHWEKSLSEAFKKAKIEDKTLMVMVQSPHCRWCVKMKRDTLADSNISKRLKQFILVKIERGSEESKNLPYAKYLPTIYFIKKDKIVLEKVIGYCGVMDFNSWIDDVKKREIE